MRENTESFVCARCGKKLEKTDFKIKSLFNTTQWVCEDCALLEDEEWLNDKKQILSPEYQ